MASWISIYNRGAGCILWILIFLSFGSSLAFAGTDLTPLGETFVIAAPSPDQQAAFTENFHDVALAGDGSITATWVLKNEAESNKFPYPVYARRFDADGAPLSEIIEVSAGNPDNSNQRVAPRVASDAVGNFVVCWAQLQTPSKQQYIYARLFNADGSPRGDAFQVSDAVYYNELSVDMNADGLFVVVWHGKLTDEDTDSINNRPILARRFSSDGNALDDAPILANASDKNLKTRYVPSVAVNDDGQFVIGWTDQLISSNWTWQVRWLVRKFNADGNPIGAAKVVQRRYETMAIDLYPWLEAMGLNGNNSVPAVAINNSGEFAISWFPSNDSIGPYYQFYRRSGIARGWPSLLVAEDVWTTRRMANALDEDGNLIMVFIGNLPDCNVAGNFISRISKTVSDPETILPVEDCGTLDSSEPDIDINTDGDIAVIWNDGQQLYGRLFK